MQIFIKLPEPYRTRVIEISRDNNIYEIINIINNNTILKNVNYYIFNGTTIFTGDLLKMTIDEFNKKYPYKMICDESTFQVHIRNYQ